MTWAGMPSPRACGSSPRRPGRSWKNFPAWRKYRCTTPGTIPILCTIRTRASTARPTALICTIFRCTAIRSSPAEASPRRITTISARWRWWTPTRFPPCSAEKTPWESRWRSRATCSPWWGWLLYPRSSPRPLRHCRTTTSTRTPPPAVCTSPERSGRRHFSLTSPRTWPSR